MKVIQTADLVDSLLNIKNAVASTVMTDLIDRCLFEVQTKDKVLHSYDPETIEIRQILENYSEYVLTESAAKLYSKTPIFCHDKPVCNALARETMEGIPFVLIYRGLLNVCTYRLCLSIIIYNIQLMFKEMSIDVVTANLHLQTLAFNAMALSYWYYISGDPDPLPQFSDLLCDEHKQQVFHGLGGALSFIAMHEIGHIELGHVSADSNPIPQIYSTIEAEGISKWKIMEYEADAFAISCFKEDIRKEMISNLFIVLDLFSDMECMCLPRSISHPLAMNRISNLTTAMKLEDHEFYSTQVQNLLAKKKLIITERAKVFPDAVNLTETINARMAISNFKTLLPSQEECLKSVETLKAIYDGKDYIGYSLGANN